jgi:hypothetical protein
MLMNLKDLRIENLRLLITFNHQYKGLKCNFQEKKKKKRERREMNEQCDFNVPEGAMVNYYRC